MEGFNHLELFSLNCIVPSVYQNPRSELGEIAAERIKHILITGHVFTVKWCVPELCNPFLAQKRDVSLCDGRCHTLQNKNDGLTIMKERGGKQQIRLSVEGQFKGSDLMAIIRRINRFQFNKAVNDYLTVSWWLFVRTLE